MSFQELKHLGEARAAARLRDQKLTHRQIAERLGKRPDQIKGLLQEADRIARREQFERERQG